jgi:hypothetical protein
MYSGVDPTIGRFTGVDPIADKFAFVSGYNYAENSPIGNIDLHGLQAVDARVNMMFEKLNNQLGRPADKLRAFFNKYGASPSTQNRINLGTNGLKNTTLGVLTATGGAVLAPESAGTSIALIVIGVTEAGVGLGQMTDAIMGDADPASSIHNSENLPGLIAHESGSEYAGLIDNVASVAPSVMTGGLRAATGVDDLVESGTKIKQGNLSGAAASALQGQDAASDFSGAVNEVGNLLSNSNSSGNQSNSGSGMELLNMACRTCQNK